MSLGQFFTAYWLLFVALVCFIALLGQTLLREARLSKRRLRLLQDRHDRVAEDVFWRYCGAGEYLLALRLRRERLAGPGVLNAALDRAAAHDAMLAANIGIKVGR